MNKKHVLIFDFDGTIANTFYYILRIANRLSDEFQFNKISPNEVENLKNKNVYEAIQHLNIPLLKVPMIVAKAKNELNKEINSIEPIEGLKEILLQMKFFGHQMGILTSNSSKNVMEFLNNHQLNFFDFIQTTPKIWSKNRSLKTLMNANKLQLSDVIYIGDETRDIDAAKKAGVRSAAVTWGYNSSKALEARNPDYLIHTPKDLARLFNQIS
jgi:phosphoglycolate phosphatase-like HAD superfamily hydrolase